MGVGSNQGYKKIRQIGSGGFGDVFLVEKENKYYALKKLKFILTKAEKDKYDKLLNTLFKINNEYIIKYYHSFVENNYFNVVMEYGDNTNLKQFIQKYKIKSIYIDEKIIEKIIIQICLGLKEIHKNNIIHRDLTPDNIFIDKNNKIKIGDFGISKILTTSKPYGKTMIGKHHYFAPEIEKGEKHNNKIDIYSLGCIIYELFTLNEYYIDTKIDDKDGKINTDIYNSKWQDLIDLLLKKDYNERPDIDEILIKLNLNEIKITIEVSSYNIGKKLNF